MPTSLAETIATLDNDHRPTTREFATRTGLHWHTPTPAHLGHQSRLSVVIPAFNSAHSLPTVLDALAHQRTAARVQVIVVDDASTDDTPHIAAGHPRVDTAVRLHARTGSGMARNVGLHLATGDTVVFLDADMVLPDHVLADIAARAQQDTVLVGFRHNIAYQPSPDGAPIIPPGEPDLEADHRVRWTPPTGVPMFYSGQIYHTPFVGRPLDDTADFIRLGHGATYYDWDLPRMVVTALVTAPRTALLDVGGFDPGFGPPGWGAEDTHLGAALIAQGCKIIPLRQARGWHIDPPDAAAAWKAKLATAAPRIAHLRQLLHQPPPSGRGTALARQAEPLIREAEILA